MDFEVYCLRKEGVLVPRHILWCGMVRGQLFIFEQHDAELNRAVRTAVIRRDLMGPVLLGPLSDAAIVSAKPDWWTMTGWERLPETTNTRTRAVQQSWILIPAPYAYGERVPRPGKREDS